MPTSGGWCKMPDAIRYALSVKPRKVFPVHDGGLNEKGLIFNKRIPSMVLEENSIQFINLEIGKETDL